MMLASRFSDASVLETLDLSSNFVCKKANDTIIRFLSEPTKDESLISGGCGTFAGSLTTLHLRDNLLPTDFAE